MAAPLVSLETRQGVSTSRLTNKKINSTKTGGVAPGDSTKIRAKNTAGKLPSPRGRQVNNEERWIFTALRFNVYVIFFKEIILSVLSLLYLHCTQLWVLSNKRSYTKNKS